MEEICPKRSGENLNELMLNVSMNMRDKRKELGVTQNDVAYCIGSDKSVISSIETGTKNNVCMNTLVKISQALEISVVELIS